MTAVAAVHQAPNIHANAPSADLAPPNNFLSRCVIDLKPETIADLEWDKSFYEGMATATLVFYGIVAVGVVLAVGTFAYAYLSFAAVGTFCFAPKFLELSLSFQAEAKKNEEKADRLKEIAHRFNELPTEPRLIEMKLHGMHIYGRGLPGVQQLEDLNRFKPLIARYDYLVNKQMVCENHAAELRNTEQQLRAQFQAAETVEKKIELEHGENGIKKHRWAVFTDEQNALKCKIQAAFIHAVIERPDFAGNFDTLAEVIDTPLAERALAREFNDTALADNFVQFKQRDVRPLTLDEVKAQPILVLARRFTEAMPPAA